MDVREANLRSHGRDRPLIIRGSREALPKLKKRHSAVSATRSGIMADVVSVNAQAKPLNLKPNMANAPPKTNNSNIAVAKALAQGAIGFPCE